MMISAVIPTYNREELLREAVLSVLSQDLPGVETEVIVVNDAAEPLHHADWQDLANVSVVNTHQQERCVARNTGADLAKGKYLHFLDDDDTILPGAYAALLQSAEATGGVFAFGSYEAVIHDGDTVNVVRPIAVGHAYAVLVAGMGIPLGSGLLRRDAFLAAGGFDLSFTIMEDLELLQRVSVLGEFTGIETVVARFRTGGHIMSTTDRSAGAEACRIQREKAFCHPDCFAKLTKSLKTHRSPSLRGCLVRYYFGSASRNTKQGRALTAIGRIGSALLLMGPGLAHGRFWAAACGRETPVVPGLDTSK